MPTMKIMAEWDKPEPPNNQITDMLMELGFYDIDIDMDSDDNPHGWGV